MFHSCGRAVNESRLTPALGLVTDIVGYGRRSTGHQRQAQERLCSITKNVLADIGVRSDELLFDGISGDGTSIILPAATDPVRTLPILLSATVAQLIFDNERYKDQLRIRMAVGFGLVGHGPLGLIGQLIVELARLNESASIRSAVVDYPESQVVVLISHLLHQLVDEAGLPSLERVDVAVKEYRAPAWLWISSAHS